jgi:predicted nucleotide-binding protein
MPQSPLPKLLVSQERAAELLKEQINKGHQITDKLSPSIAGHGFDRLMALQVTKTAGEKWAKFTIDLLKSLIADLSIGNEFGSSIIRNYGGDPTTEFLQWMDDRLHRLDSILQRLPLFPLAENQVQAATTSASSKKQSRDIFIVHGHDDAAKHEVARFIVTLGLHPIILHEQADRGRTVIEKFEAHADVEFAVVLLTPDDMGYPKDKPSEAKPRARQNVVLELGFFIGKLGRSRVCALRKGDVEIEIPNDIAGVLYTPMDAAGTWQIKLATEIRAAGIDEDLTQFL